MAGMTEGGAVRQASSGPPRGTDEAFASDELSAVLVRADGSREVVVEGGDHRAARIAARALRRRLDLLHGRPRGLAGGWVRIGELEFVRIENGCAVEGRLARDAESAAEFERRLTGS